jgi:tellurite resistance protein
VFTAIYVVQSIQQTQKVRTDIENPISGPFIAFIPVVAVLLSQHYAQYAPIAGTYAILFFVTILAAIAARLAAHWISGGLPNASVMHGGYLVPVVAGPFIASIGLTSVGLHDLALYAFGAGLFFWLTLGTIVMYSHIAGGRVQRSASPALTAFLAASATASIAWLVAHPAPGPPDALQSILTGVLFIMLFVQIALIRQYRRLPFGMEYWVFTFPVASTANYLIRWLAQVNAPGWQLWAWGILALSTAFVGVIGIGTAVALIRGRRSKSAELAGN